MSESNWWSKAGAIFYVIWGLLHVQAAYLVYLLGTSMAPSMAQGRIYQNAWNLLCFAISAMAVATGLNWRNSKLGYIINLAIVSVTDIGFVLFVLMPGYLPIWPGIAGPVFWIVGAACSTIALRRDL